MTTHSSSASGNRNEIDGDQSTRQNQQDDSEQPIQDGNNEPARCAACNGEISQDDLVCPHCGITLASG